MKDAYYFPHDSNAIQDPKMMTLLSECGLYGVGLYWVLIEVLHQQPCGAIGVPELRHYINFYGKQSDYNEIILSKIEKVLFDTKLLINDGKYVYSERVKNNLKIRAELSEQGRLNALKRWGANGVPMATNSDPNAIKERKRKEKKGKEETPIVPLKGDVETLIPEDLLLNILEIKDWLEYKKQKGQSYKPKGLEALWKSLRVIAPEKRREAVDHSMANNWSGLFEKRGANGQQGTNAKSEIGKPERADSKFSEIVRTVKID